MKRWIVIFFIFLPIFCSAQTLYLVSPAEADNTSMTLTTRGLNHSLLLVNYFKNIFSATASLYILTASPEHMRSGSCSNYKTNPNDCIFDSTPFATIDPIGIAYNIDLHHSNATSATDYSAAVNDIHSGLLQASNMIMSWPRTASSGLITALGCAVPAGYTASAGQIAKMTLTNAGGSWQCTTSQLINDGLNPTSVYPNLMNQNGNKIANWATVSDKYLILIRHMEKTVNTNEATCPGLNRGFMVPYHLLARYGVADMVLAGSLDDSSTRPLEKIVPYAVLNNKNIKVLPVTITGSDLQNLISNLMNDPNNHLVIMSWEHDNARRIANAIATANWSADLHSNSPFFWDDRDFDQNIVFHYHCAGGGTSCILQNDYYIADEDYENLLPATCNLLFN